MKKIPIIKKKVTGTVKGLSKKQMFKLQTILVNSRLKDISVKLDIRQVLDNKHPDNPKYIEFLDKVVDPSWRKFKHLKLEM